MCMDWSHQIIDWFALALLNLRTITRDKMRIHIFYNKNWSVNGLWHIHYDHYE